MYQQRHPLATIDNLIQMSGGGKGDPKRPNRTTPIGGVITERLSKAGGPMDLPEIAGQALAACVISVIATFQKHVPRTTKMAMWASASASLLACAYVSHV